MKIKNTHNNLVSIKTFNKFLSDPLMMFLQFFIEVKKRDFFETDIKLYVRFQDPCSFWILIDHLTTLAWGHGFILANYTGKHKLLYKKYLPTRKSEISLQRRRYIFHILLLFVFNRKSLWTMGIYIYEIYWKMKWYHNSPNKWMMTHSPLFIIESRPHDI